MSTSARLSTVPDKRRRRSKAQIEQLERQIFDVLREDHPQSVRHVFYRMNDPRLPEPVEKTHRGYKQVQDRLVKMREAGNLPYGWITDATRRGYHVQTFHNSEGFLRHVAGLYRQNLWAQADHYCEVWVESRSIAGIVEDDCAQLAVSLYPAGGFTSLTLPYEAATYIERTTRGGELPAEVVYIGDLDPAGVLIDADINKKLRAHLPADMRLNFHRIAITEEQIAQHDLPTKPRNPNERRARHIDRTVEAEALPAGIMRRLLREKVESFLPPTALQVARAAEESERQLIYGLADSMSGGPA